MKSLCRIVAVTLPPALDGAFMVSRIAAQSSLYDQGRTPEGETLFSRPQPPPPCPPA
jgi:hypothetical protein